MADPADADVIRTVHRDAVPCQRAIGGGELVAARAGVGGAPLHLNVDGGVLANRQADSRARFIGESLFCRSNHEAPRRQAGRLKVPPPSVAIVRVAPVSTFLIVTATSGRAAPVWSVTTPERLAPVWAHAAPSMQRKATVETMATAIGRYFTSLSPSIHLLSDRSSRPFERQPRRGRL